MTSRKHSSSSSRATGGSSKRRSRPPMTFAWVWYCSNCSTGPLNSATDQACPSCCHWRCQYCSMQQIAMPESPVINNRSPKIGDLVSYEGGNTVASLGPILEFSGKRYFLVPADLFRGANFESSVPVGVKLVHPAGLDSPTGLTPKEIGVFSYWSGIPEAGIKSTQPGDYTESNWALCEVTYAPLLREDQSHIIRYQQSGNSSRRIPDILTQSPSSRNVVLGRRDTETKSFKVSEGPWFEPILTLGSKNIPPTKKWYIEYTLEPNSGSGRWTPREKNGAFLFDEEFGDLVGMVSGYENNDNDNRLRVYFTSIVDIFDNIQQKYPEIGRPIIFGGSSSAAKTEEEAFFKKIRSFIDRSSARESGEIGANAAQTHTSEEKNHENQSHDFDGDLNSDVFSSISSMFSGVESTTSYSSVQHSEAQALREVVATLFVEDEVILESFKNALTPEAAGATAMTVVLRNGLRDMGKALKVESKTSEQGLCARRIRRDAQFIADSVRRKCDPKFQAPQLDIEYIKLPMSQEEQRRHLMSMWLRSQSSPFEQAVEQSGYPSGSQMDYPTNMEEGPDTSDDEQIDPEAEQALNQKIQELKVFILESEHMQTLRHKLHVAASNHNVAVKHESKCRRSDKEPRQEARGARVGNNALMKRSLPELIDRWLPQWLESFWEPRLPQGAKRIRWVCTCGKSLYDDYNGLEEAQLQRVEQILNRSKPSGHIQAPAKGTQTGWASHIATWTTTVLSAIPTVLRQNEMCATSLPTHNPITTNPPIQPPVPSNAQNNRLFLLFSLSSGKKSYAKVLHHASIEPTKLENDNDLFTFLRESFYSERKLISRLTLRTVSGIGNCRLLVDFSRFIQSLQRHSNNCPTDSVFGCSCWPDSTAVGDYRYIPQMPTEPFLMERNYLLHHFRNPGCLDPMQKSVICYIPMKKDSELRGETNRPVTGWGVYFEEDWHWQTVSVVVTALMIIVSIALGLSWWLFKLDFSGAWGVASFCVTTTTLVVTVIVSMAHKSY